MIVPHKFKGLGEVLTYTIVHSAGKDYAKNTPYILAIIRLEEGPTLTSQVVCEDHSRIHIGMKVKPAFRRLGEESERGMIYYGTKFVPTKEQDMKV